MNQPVTLSEPACIPPVDDELVAIRFINTGVDVANGVQTGLERLGPTAGDYESLSFGEPVLGRGVSEGISWARSENFQFLSIEIAQVDLQHIQSIANEAYAKLLTYVGGSDYPHLVRFWNYIPKINEGDGDEEVYRRFCSGRLQAFELHQLQVANFPAASAVGNHRSNLTICAVSSVKRPVHHTNPQQVDAYDYPRQYGPTSPSFARGTSLELANKLFYFVSGTASILGHRSLHKDNIDEQLQLTRQNIMQLLSLSELSADSVVSMRVYLRNPSDFEASRRFIETSFPKAETLYVHADICRSELLVEVECTCSVPRELCLDAPD